MNLTWIFLPFLCCCFFSFLNCNVPCFYLVENTKILFTLIKCDCQSDLLILISQHSTTSASSMCSLFYMNICMYLKCISVLFCLDSFEVVSEFTSTNELFFLCFSRNERRIQVADVLNGILHLK